jgi:GxxExxY protein
MTTTAEQLDAISYSVIGAAIEVHKVIGGPGLLEKVYEEALAKELNLRGHKVVRQQHLPVMYKGETLNTPLIIDILVDDQIIIECKACEKHNPIYETQLLTYLRVAGKQLGLVINFGETYLKDGIHRVVNHL